MQGSKRFSHQREEIYTALRGCTSHPTAETVYSWLKPAMPKLSLGTVYRNLHQMAEEGRLKELNGTVSRFDATVNPHTHIQCTCCGQVADGILPYDERLDQAAVAAGWTITDHNLMFTGICPACAGL